MEYMEDILVPIAICCVLPIVIVWLVYRQKIMVSRDHTRIVLAAIEKNPNMDLEELMEKISPKKKLLKEKLLSRLLWGGIFAFAGFSIFASNLWLDYLGGADPEMLSHVYVSGGVLFSIGLAFIINFLVGKKMLAKEMEAEQMKVMSEK